MKGRDLYRASISNPTRTRSKANLCMKRKAENLSITIPDHWKTTVPQRKRSASFEEVSSVASLKPTSSSSGLTPDLRAMGMSALGSPPKLNLTGRSSRPLSQLSLASMGRCNWRSPFADTGLPPPSPSPRMKQSWGHDFEADSSPHSIFRRQLNRPPFCLWASSDQKIGKPLAAEVATEFDMLSDPASIFRLPKTPRSFAPTQAFGEAFDMLSDPASIFQLPRTPRGVFAPAQESRRLRKSMPLEAAEVEAAEILGGV